MAAVLKRVCLLHASQHLNTACRKRCWAPMQRCTRACVLWVMHPSRPSASEGGRDACREGPGERRAWRSWYQGCMGVLQDEHAVWDFGWGQLQHSGSWCSADSLQQQVGVMWATAAHAVAIVTCCQRHMWQGCAVAAAAHTEKAAHKTHAYRARAGTSGDVAVLVRAVHPGRELPAGSVLMCTVPAVTGQLYCTTLALQGACRLRWPPTRGVPHGHTFCTAACSKQKRLPASMWFVM